MHPPQKHHSRPDAASHTLSELGLASTAHTSALPALMSVYEQHTRHLARLVDTAYCSGDSTINQATTELRGIGVLASHFSLLAQTVSTLSIVHRALCTVDENLSPDQFDPLGGAVSRSLPSLRHTPTYAQSVYSSLIASSRCLNSTMLSPLRVLTSDGCFNHVEECHLTPFGSNPVDVLNVITLKDWIKSGVIKEATLTIRGPLDPEFINWVWDIQNPETALKRGLQVIYDLPLPSGSHAPFILYGQRKGEFAALPAKTHSARPDFQAMVNFSAATKSETHHPLSSLNHSGCNMTQLPFEQGHLAGHFFDFVQTFHSQQLWDRVHSMRKANGKEEPVITNYQSLHSQD